MFPLTLKTDHVSSYGSHGAGLAGRTFGHALRTHPLVTHRSLLLGIEMLRAAHVGAGYAHNRVVLPLKAEQALTGCWSGSTSDSTPGLRAHLHTSLLRTTNSSFIS